MATEEETVSFSLEINTENAYTSIRKIQAIIFRVLHLLERMGLGTHIRDVINNAQRVMSTLSRLRLSIQATKLAMAGAMGPLGWVWAGLTAAEVAMDVQDYIDDYMGVQ